MVKIVYFAWVRERIGKAEETVDLPAGIATIADLVGWLRARGPEYANAFAKAASLSQAAELVDMNYLDSVKLRHRLAHWWEICRQHDEREHAVDVWIPHCGGSEFRAGIQFRVGRPKSGLVGQCGLVPF